MLDRVEDYRITGHREYDMSVTVDINDMKLKTLLDGLIDDTTMLQIHNLFAKMCDPYVPFLEGPLSQSAFANVKPDGVTYSTPYAHYQYVGQNFNHTLDYHPKATAFWDKVMMSEKGEEFAKQVEDILTRRAKELYG